MTLIAGANVGYYVILAADSRVTFLADDVSVLGVEEATAKLRRTPSGIAAGSGLTHVIFGAIQDLSQNYPRDLRDGWKTAQYLRNFMGAYLHAARPGYEGKAMQDQLHRQAWMFSRREGKRLVLHRHHMDRENYGPEEFPVGLAATILPMDMTAEKSLPHEMQMLRELVRCPSLRDVDRTLPLNVAAIARYFKAIDCMSEHLGPGIQIGVHFQDGEIELLPIEALESLDTD